MALAIIVAVRPGAEQRDWRPLIDGSLALARAMNAKFRLARKAPLLNLPVERGAAEASPGKDSLDADDAIRVGVHKAASNSGLFEVLGHIRGNVSRVRKTPNRRLH
jgi:hypothetical protein